jgi:hypothetical protein
MDKEGEIHATIRTQPTGARYRALSNREARHYRNIARHVAPWQAAPRIDE